MAGDFSPMRSPDSTIRAGAFSSDNLAIETPWHYHDFHQLLYAFEGSVEVEGQFARYKVPHQFAAWIPAGTVHRTAIQLVRSGSIFLRTDMLNLPLNSLRVIAAPSLMREMIKHAMRWPIDGKENEISVAFFECFAQLCSEWINQEVKLVLPAADNPRINAIVDFTRTNLATVKLTDVCTTIGMSPRSLRRNFQKEMGISWEDLRLRLRMHAAIEALDKTRKPIGEIAIDVGYASQAAFSRAFNAIMGISPNAYRKDRK